MQNQEISQLCEAIGKAIRTQIEPLVQGIAELKNGGATACVAQPQREIKGYSDAETRVMLSALESFKERERAAAREEAESEAIAAQVAEMCKSLVESGRIKA